MLSTLDSLLLLLLALPIPLRYRLLPVEGTPYWLFGILFLLIFGNIFLSLYPPRKISKYIEQIKTLIVWLVLIIVVGGVTVTAIVDRSKTAPQLGVHDIILQQEGAMRYLLEGKNPYKETYFGTLLESWNYDEQGKPAVNPALYHFVMPPWYLLFPFAFYFLSVPFFGFFDGRMALLFCLLGMLILLWRWFADKRIARVAMILAVLAPGIVDYFIEGRSDTFALFWLIWSLYLLDRRKLLLSAVMFGLAVTSKQTIWFAVPFYLVYVWIGIKTKVRGRVSAIILVFAVVAALTLPFLLWDPKAFVDSTVFYLSGNTSYGYPISGYGLGMVLYSLGVIRDIHEYYPFILWQAVFGLPVIMGSLWFLIQKPGIVRLLAGYGASLGVIWYMSRYFNNSHIGYLAVVFLLAILKQWDEQKV
ncbi:glycosyltransferase family 39 protein [Patescibacteria group bacterium]|nr:glycosyltransferase family 39 protein [Patescibacteria group bacterium]MBU1472757.1 glycosyltransferase family 39 protein [Patescibacteria group bacterium]MBU2460023.1 glycosyltransferase family 39 protein [Patescibacteria group bacterium]MBU2544319.1 glycosyltransferase family 39 protein [Patescibacteria group bacterium]